MAARRLGGLLSVLGAVVAAVSAFFALPITFVWLLFSLGMPLQKVSPQALWLASPYLGVAVGGLVLAVGKNLRGVPKRPLWAIPLLCVGGVTAGAAGLFLLILLGGQNTVLDLGSLAALAAPALIATAVGVVAILWGLRGLGRGPLASRLQL